jgi:hypothetical protein
MALFELRMFLVQVWLATSVLKTTEYIHMNLNKTIGIIIGGQYSRDVTTAWILTEFYPFCT